jgi:predicted XRE-type DNA-binding protein
MKKRQTRSVDALTTLDDFLQEQGKLAEFEAVAVKEVLAWQIAEAMRVQNLSRKRLAERMKTSRSQISRLLDPKDGNVTIATLQRAAKIVGRTLRLELV